MSERAEGGDMAGKGSRQRPTDTEKYGENWERIFRGTKGTHEVQVSPLAHEPGMATECLEYRGAPNAHVEGMRLGSHGTEGSPDE